MPTYENENPVEIQVKGPDGRIAIFDADESKEIDFYTNDSRLTFISDTPYVNRVIAIDDLNLTSDQTVAVSLSTDTICFLSISDSITVYTQSTENTPPELKNHTAGDPVILIPAKARFNQVIVSGTGTCRMVQYRNI
jgi:hypothetical protein